MNAKLHSARTGYWTAATLVVILGFAPMAGATGALDLEMGPIEPTTTATSDFDESENCGLSGQNCGRLTAETESRNCSFNNGDKTCDIEGIGSVDAFDWINPGSWSDATMTLSGGDVSCTKSIPDRSWSSGGAGPLNENCVEQDTILDTQCEVYDTDTSATFSGTDSPNVPTASSSIQECA